MLDCKLLNILSNPCMIDKIYELSWDLGGFCDTDGRWWDRRSKHNDDGELGYVIHYRHGVTEYFDGEGYSNTRVVQEIAYRESLIFGDRDPSLYQRKQTGLYAVTWTGPDESPDVMIKEHIMTPEDVKAYLLRNHEIHYEICGEYLKRNRQSAQWEPLVDWVVEYDEIPSEGWEAECEAHFEEESCNDDRAPYDYRFTVYEVYVNALGQWSGGIKVDSYKFSAEDEDDVVEVDSYKLSAEDAEEVDDDCSAGQGVGFEDEDDYI